MSFYTAHSLCFSPVSVCDILVLSFNTVSFPFDVVTFFTTSDRVTVGNHNPFGFLVPNSYAVYKIDTRSRRHGHQPIELPTGRLAYIVQFSRSRYDCGMLMQFFHAAMRTLASTDAFTEREGVHVDK
jgi:hypothetical protein